MHDLRHTYASVAASGGQSLVIIGKLVTPIWPTIRLKQRAMRWIGILRRRWAAARAATLPVLQGQTEYDPNLRERSLQLTAIIGRVLIRPDEPYEEMSD